jgi:hypothetical protein
MTAVTQGGGLDGVEDFGGSTDGARHDCGSGENRPLRIIIPARLRCCKKKETIWKWPILGVFFAGDRAQGARALGGVDQSTIGTDLEDETVGKGRGC